MTEEESLEAGHLILVANGWRPIPKAPWNGRCAVPGLVGGVSPSGDQYAKAYTAFPQAMAAVMGLDPADYPDEAHEAAAWLVRHVQGRVAPAPEPEQSGNDETDSETVPEGDEISALGSPAESVSVGDGGVSESDAVDGSVDGVPNLLGPGNADDPIQGNPASDDVGLADEIPEPVREEIGSPAEASPGAVDLGDADAAPGDAGSPEDGATDSRGLLRDDDGSSWQGSGDDIIDAEYADPDDRDLLALEDQSAPVAIEGGDIDPLLIEALTQEDEPVPVAPVVSEPNYSDQARFYGLDDLDRRRSLRIGDVSRYAIAIRAPWTSVDDARLVELRNFAMGVAEGRWPNDAALEAELGTLEATLGRNNAIDQALQAKVTFLNGATREEVEAFVVEDGWP